MFTFLAIGHEVGEPADSFLQDLHTEKSLVEKNPVLGKLIIDDSRYDFAQHSSIT